MINWITWRTRQELTLKFIIESIDICTRSNRYDNRFVMLCYLVVFFSWIINYSDNIWRDYGNFREQIDHFIMVFKIYMCIKKNGYVCLWTLLYFLSKLRQIVKWFVVPNMHIKLVISINRIKRADVDILRHTKKW